MTTSAELAGRKAENSEWLDVAVRIGLVAYGVYTVYLLVRRPEELAFTENHPSWTHMYLMMMVAQIGFALAYVL